MLSVHARSCHLGPRSLCWSPRPSLNRWKEGKLSHHYQSSYHKSQVIRAELEPGSTPMRFQEPTYKKKKLPRLFLCTISGHFLTVTSQVCSLHVISDHKCLLACVAWAQVIGVRVSVPAINVQVQLWPIYAYETKSVLRVTCNTGGLQYFQYHWNQKQTLAELGCRILQPYLCKMGSALHWGKKQTNWVFSVTPVMFYSNCVSNFRNPQNIKDVCCFVTLLLFPIRLKPTLSLWRWRITYSYEAKLCFTISLRSGKDPTDQVFLHEHWQLSLKTTHRVPSTYNF